MSHKLEDVQVKTNKLTEEAGQGSEDRAPNERREDRGDNDTQPTPSTETTSTNHRERKKLKGSSLFHSPTYLGSTISTTGGTSTDDDVEVSQSGSERQQDMLSLT
ncbi:unnamed protein product [Heterobilharzia americana]|nr:unnamed protein product [Heterobilharzia americana]